MNAPKNKFNHFLAGFIPGLLIPFLCFLWWSKIFVAQASMREIVALLQQLNLTSKILSLSVFSNLAVFFLLLWSIGEKAARGVLAATFVYAIVIIILKSQG
ncbi:MAG: hypothetical protein RIQ89_1561 [Bacteroidota bacterium]|jgi:hypothetical protein